jgi:hypothetical protein
MKKVAQQEISTIQKKNAILAQYQVKVSKVKRIYKKGCCCLVGQLCRVSSQLLARDSTASPIVLYL